MNARPLWRGALMTGLACVSGVSFAEQRLETFDTDPGWDGHNNRPPEQSARTVTQDFGYSASGGPDLGQGAIGGTISPDGAPAYYAKEIPIITLQNSFSASGALAVKEGAGNTLLGFFNSHTLNEWRTPNTIAFRINGRGEFFHVHIEYATNKWRAGASVIGRHDRAADRVYPLEISSGGVHRWSLAYDPSGKNGGGSIVAAFDDQRAVCNLEPGHKLDGASFDRFGLLNVVKHADSPGELWIGPVAINGTPENLETEPDWKGFQNRRTYVSEDVRPCFNFGYSPTRYAGGTSAGEMGGLFFRGDCRYPARLAYYGARLEPLTLERSLRASGKLTLRRGVTDSSTLFGYFHATHSVWVNPAQSDLLPMNFLGMCIEGPSSEGFFVYPCYRLHGDEQSHGRDNNPPRIYPDGTALRWTLEYDPAGAGGDGAITVGLGDQTVTLKLQPGHKSAGCEFNRFGLITPWIDGNGQMVYFDDIEYTCR